MTHGEKTNLFLGELEKLFSKYNVCIGIEGDPKAQFCLLDLNGPMNVDWRARILDFSIHAVKSIASDVIDLVVPSHAKDNTKTNINSNTVSDVEVEAIKDTSQPVFSDTPIDQPISSGEPIVNASNDYEDDAA